MKSLLIGSLLLALSSCAALQQRQEQEELKQKVEICAVSVIPMLHMMGTQYDMAQVIQYCIHLHSGAMEKEQENVIEVEMPDSDEVRII